jgi:hypothetical protein
MKSYLVTFAPHENAPPGNLGKPDYFGFVTKANNMADAETIAKVKFERAFGRDLTELYQVKDIEVQS